MNTISEWSNKLNIDRRVISQRLFKGWTTEKTLSTSVI